jgi:DNA-binding NtrC family response regulator
LARLLGHVLASAGYQIEQAATVADARSALAADSYDLALVDARLPDGTGMDVADCAAQHGTRALIVTGYAFAYPELRDYEYLLKPVRPDELLREVERMLRSPA